MSEAKAWNVTFIRSEIILASTREEVEEIAEDFRRKQEMVGRIEEANQMIKDIKNNEEGVF